MPLNQSKLRLLVVCAASENHHDQELPSTASALSLGDYNHAPLIVIRQRAPVHRRTANLLKLFDDLRTSLSHGRSSDGPSEFCLLAPVCRQNWISLRWGLDKFTMLIIMTCY
jgi:hypothetical protein